MIKSPLRYPGGKSRAVKVIAPIIPDFQEYREPFVGGGSLFVYLKQKYPKKNYWINDLHTNLFHFWKQIQQNIEPLIHQIFTWRIKFKNGKDLHKHLLENIETYDELERAAAFFILNRITFSGTSESGGFSNSAFEKRFTGSSIQRVKLLSKILNDIKITNHDYQSVITKEGKNVFIFLDPPYYSARNSALYGKNGNLHKTFNHEKFADNLKNIKHKWLITYDDSHYIRKLFSFANITPWTLTYGMRNVTKNGDQKGKELFISNYDLIKVKYNAQKTLFNQTPASETILR